MTMVNSGLNGLVESYVRLNVISYRSIQIKVIYTQRVVALQTEQLSENNILI